MFRTVPLSIIRSLALYTQQWYTPYRFADSLLLSQAISKPVWHMPVLCVQWITPDDGQRNCPKHVEFYSKNKFQKLVHLVGFITSLRAASCQQTCMTYTSAVRSVNNFWWWTEELSETCRVSFQKQIWEISESSWFYYKNLSRFTATWTSNDLKTFANWGLYYFNYKLGTRISS